MDLKGSQTEANLLTAFAGESQARNKYTFFAAEAKKNGYEQISAIFDKTADNEKAHAEIWFKYLKDGSLPQTLDALIEAASGEHYEWAEMYKEFSEIAEKEGFNEIAFVMKKVGEIEKEHEDRFLKLADNIKLQKVFKKDNESTWVCRNCGYVHKGKEAPGVCPVCKYKEAYFEIKETNY